MPEKTPAEENEDAIKALSIRITKLEKDHFRATVFAGALTLLLGGTLGLTLWQIPTSARNAANAALPDLVAKEAENVLPGLVANQVKKDLSPIVSAEAQRQLPDLLKKEGPAAMQAAVRAETDVVAILSKMLIEEFSTVARASADSRAEIANYNSEALGLKEKFEKVKSIVDAIEKSKEFDAGRVLRQLNESPDAKKLLEKITAVERRLDAQFAQVMRPTDVSEELPSPRSDQQMPSILRVRPQYVRATYSSSALPTVIYYYAEVVGLCRKVSPLVEQFYGEYADQFTIFRVHGYDDLNQMGSTGIKWYPTIIFLRDGTEVERIENLTTLKEIKETADRVLAGG